LFWSKNCAATVAIIAFIVALTQYAVSQWIWFGGKTKRSPHHCSVYLVSAIVFWYVWSSIFDVWLIVFGGTGDIPMGQKIATIVVMLVGAPIHFTFCRVWTVVFPPTEDTKEQEENGVVTTNAANEDEDADEEEAVEKEDTPARTAKPKNVKVYYINNIKIFLTAMVIIFHAAVCVYDYHSLFQISINVPKTSLGCLSLNLFSKINASYFMHLFFFFSGFFVPKSFDKKGTDVFIMERAKRLGIPATIYSFFIGPFCPKFPLLFLVPGESSFIWIFFYPGSCWFIMQLLLFNIVYAFACGKGWSPKISCPSLLGFFGIASVLGLISGITTMFFGVGQYLILVPSF
jgi:hypothetical protein